MSIFAQTSHQTELLHAQQINQPFCKGKVSCLGHLACYALQHQQRCLGTSFLRFARWLQWSPLCSQVQNEHVDRRIPPKIASNASKSRQSEDMWMQQLRPRYQAESRSMGRSRGTTCQRGVSLIPASASLRSESVS